MEIMKEIADLQKEYRKLLRNKKLTKKAMCDLVVPFRDKYKLSNKDALAIVRNELSLTQIVKIMGN